MSKLPDASRFFDLSDYGRPVARWIVRVLVPTRVSSIHLTFAFLAAGLAGIYMVWQGQYVLAALALIFKSILDAADGEMARVRSHPTRTGRYLDSIFDFAVNLGVLHAVFATTGASTGLFLASFVCLEFQGTIFNYYYLVQRRICSGDTTSRINEFARPVPFAYENARMVDVLHRLYLVCYGPFDAIMIRLDRAALGPRPLPSLFMTLVSSMGLGFQILLIAVLLVVGKPDWILTFFVWYSAWGLVIIGIRKALGRQEP